MTIHPKRYKDLALAPVAAQIDLNVQRLRGRTAHDVGAELELELDAPAMGADRAERERLVLRQALRDVHMSGWEAAISGDGCCVHLSGGSVTIDLGLSAGITDYIRDGASALAQGAAARA